MTLDPSTALLELRALVGTYLEGSDDAVRAFELLDALTPPPAIDLSDSEFDEKYVTNEGPAAHDTLVTHRATGVSAYVKGGLVRSAVRARAEGLAILRKALSRPAAAMPAPTAEPMTMPDDRAIAMFGCTAAAMNEALDGKEPRAVAMFAMSVLSDAQELIPSQGAVAERSANTVRQLMNVAKCAIDKAVPR